ncbi:MAG: LLM class flavin-dependent oxidoreductase [Pedobacter sp.]|nr:MAG: LLM class flavin-dependent oxidoreductase [Pedobacter sp.]
MAKLIKLSDIKYSLLDLATIREDMSIAETFDKSVEMAQHVEQWGYTRYWLAEHHNMISVASSATAILIGHIAGKTNTLRVGSGGIMLPNHSALQIAEQFGTLEHLYPNRIDLGLGRAPGTDQLTAYAIRGENMRYPYDFKAEINKLQNYISPENQHAKVRAIPGEGSNLPIWILGSSTDSAYLAAELGLPYAFASHFAPQQFMQAISIYKSHFKPSKEYDRPYILACVNAIAAETDTEAVFLSSSLKEMFSGIVTGKRQKLQPPRANIESEFDDMQLAAIEQMLAITFVGSESTIRQQLISFVKQTEIDEIMFSSNIYDTQARLKSLEIISSIFQTQF